MSVFNINPLSPGGWLSGSYVYFLCCAGDTDDSFYIKVGISDRPTKRLYELVNNCALKALTFSWCHIYSRVIARQIERRMHVRLREWQTKGEWFRFTAEEKNSRFSARRNAVLREFKTPSWPLEISTIEVEAYMVEAARRQRYMRRKYARRGRSFSDFQRHNAKTSA